MTEGFKAVRSKLKPGMKIAIRQCASVNGTPRPPYRVETISSVGRVVATEEGSVYDYETGGRLSNDPQLTEDRITVDWIATEPGTAASIGHYELTPPAEVESVNDLQGVMLHTWALRKRIQEAFSGLGFHKFTVEQLEAAAAALGLEPVKLP